MAHPAAVTAGPLHHAAPLPPLGRALAAGALAGQVAGLVMAVVVMAVFALVLGRGPLFPVQVIGSLVYGDAAVQGFHPGALVAGLVLHQAGPSLGWGIAFALLARALRLERAGELLLAGAAVGAASQLVDVGLLVPAAMRALHGHDLWAEHVPVGWSWAAHLVFGLTLACLPRVAARLGPAPAAARPAGDA